MSIINNIAFVLFFVVPTGLTTTTQKSKTDVFKLNEKVIKVHFDPIDNVYLFTDSLQLKKYNKDFELLYRYSDNRLTRTTKIITDNAFKTILFNPDFGWIKVLDRRFGEVAEFQLFQLNVLNVSAIGAAADNQSIWLYDNMQQNLLKLDQQFNITLQRNNLHIELNQWINPSSIQERAGWLFLYDQEKGVFIFDNLGTFYKRIPIKDSQSFQVKGGDIFFQKDSSLYKYNIETISTEKMVGQKAGVQYFIGSNFLFHYDALEGTIRKQTFE